MPFAQSLDYVKVEENLSTIDQLVFSGHRMNEELFILFNETNNIRKEMGHSRQYRRVSDALLKELKALEDRHRHLAA